ncbi:uncharacterized protein SOCE26_097530 [Sorangium cellulosum]|uniref:Secreted protein n=1 Tax=Sorangium cellulosum TaxID=56 RepID=A0A2L0F9Q6_SORCE|nr:hypothetical protein [Sorangium cellulosum]AUX48222.1 uncharacterized protein SOCE26_097530 [Sorangium cellulosum]
MWNVVLAALAASLLLACQSSSGPAPGEAAPPAAAAASPASPALAPAPEAHMPAPPPQAADTAAPSAAAGADPPGAGPSAGGDAYIEIAQGGRVSRLQGGCDGGRGVPQPMPGPYVEILDPDSNDPRFILTSCGAGGTHFDIVATGVKLPGELKVRRVRFLDPNTGSEWTSDSARLVVTEFTAVGAPVKGTFEATMGARLNRPAERIRGTFSLPRAPDRHAP